ncbi:GNAT family N-acetyltransferase [Antrihabitans cavernicola]|uniref:GNAT family N-acetyltransferase n=1 Tax=Antrihabitans cavernicola TaxID=2495913 RepID=A0A5A7SGU3_9NOCA|nr:GNAT family N-acetyltransferase [Spelaeibacter cavernicola]KAA0023431.1 GNAT family N-acetyltransferase [Spelaeibacter cavernicola]
MNTVAVDVSRAGLWDAEALSDVAAATFPLACPPGSSAEDIEAFVDEVLSFERFGEYLSDPSRTVLKATNVDRIVGYAMLLEGEPADPDVAAVLTVRPILEISKMYVLPGQHGTGVSTALMDASVAYARDNDYPGVWLGVNQHNARAQRFYEKSGFEKVGTKTFQVGSQIHHDFVMQKHL